MRAGYRGTSRATWLVALLTLLFVAMLVWFNTPARSADLAADIVFIIDESGTMQEEIDDVKARLDELTADLGSQVDARFGLVSFGGAPPGEVPSEPFTRVNLTERAGFLSALQTADAFGGPGSGEEYALFATTHAMTKLTGFRAGAGSCAVLITDESGDFKVDRDTDVANALAALASRNGVFFGIIPLEFPRATATFGPDPGSLAAETGGAVFSILDFRTDAGPVLTALLDQCAAAASEISTIASFTATPTSGVAPLTVRFAATSDPSISQYSWDFGDGQTGEGPDVVHTYGSAGSYTATLTVTSGGTTSSAKQTISVRPAESTVTRSSDCTIVGTAGPDVLVGTSGDDVICALGGNDVIRAGAGNDVVIAGNGNDVVRGGRGDDLLIGKLGRDVLRGGGGNDELRGLAGSDKLFGGAGSDELLGGRGKDILRGGGGPDLLNGEGGRDMLYGQGGPDRLLARDKRPELVHGGRGRDQARTDRLDERRSIEVRLR